MTRLLLLKPRISEKAYGLSQDRNVYVFEVPASANRLDVANAVASQYEVGVVKVNVSNIKGKPKRAVRKRARPTDSARSDYKKAYVTLKKGDSIATIFAAEEQSKEPQGSKK